MMRGREEKRRLKELLFKRAPKLGLLLAFSALRVEDLLEASAKVQEGLGVFLRGRRRLGEKGT